MRQVACFSVLAALALTGCSAGSPQASKTTEGSSPATTSPTAPESSPATSSSPAASTSSTPSQSGEPEPTQSTGAPESIKEKAAALAAKMSTDELAASLVMAGVPATGASAQEIASLKKQGISNVFLRGRSQLSISSTASAVKKITSALEENLPQNLPVWVATDQEGGFVRVLQGPGFSNLPTAQKQGQWRQTTLESRIEAVGGELEQAGVNVNLAPVADVVPSNIGTANAPIGYFGRQYANNAQEVSTAVLTVNQALDAAGIQPVVKHFPGLGKVKANTDVSRNVTDTVTDADNADLEPFKESISQDLSWVMISNARYSKIDAKNHAPFSKKVITGLLRGQLGYERLVISDDLCEAKQVSDVPVGQRAVKFVAAGGTMPLCVNAEDSVAMAKALSSKAESDEQFAAQLKDAAVLVLQEKLGQK